MASSSSSASQSRSETTLLLQLSENKNRIMGEQRLLSDRMNELLTKRGGFIESSHLTVKNLNAAIAISKKAGPIHYYNPPTEVIEMERNKTLNGLVQKMNKMNAEIDAINEEISHVLARQQQLHVLQQTTPIDRNLRNLSQWFETYGRPDINPANAGLLTQFERDPKVYGGTAHYRSFKTMSTKMVKGRLTR